MGYYVYITANTLITKQNFVFKTIFLVFDIVCNLRGSFVIVTSEIYCFWTSELLAVKGVYKMMWEAKLRTKYEKYSTRNHVYFVIGNNYFVFKKVLMFF